LWIGDFFTRVVYLTDERARSVDDIATSEGHTGAKGTHHDEAACEGFTLDLDATAQGATRMFSPRPSKPRSEAYLGLERA
jgi:hypothetical protein